MKRIELTQGFVAMVDDEDWGWLSQWKWYASQSSYNYYAARFAGPRGRQRKIYMHREIARRKYGEQSRVLDGQQVDHDDGDPMNNTRDNLIARTQQENLAKRKGYRPCAVGSAQEAIPF